MAVCARFDHPLKLPWSKEDQSERRPVITFSGLARDSETHRCFRDASAGLRKQIKKMKMKSKGRACVPTPSGRRAVSDASP
jgi:hypothetical protein